MIDCTITLELAAHSDELLVVLPEAADAKLPSRGTVMAEGTLQGAKVRIPLEPTGTLGHWFVIDVATRKKLGLAPGDTPKLTLEAVKQWPEPTIPAVLKQTLDADSAAHHTWEDTTPMARWEWIRWFESVKTDEAKAERPAKIMSMLAHGKRRPCCFNRAMQTAPKRLQLL